MTRRERAINAVAESFAGVISNVGGPDVWAGEQAVEAVERITGPLNGLVSIDEVVAFLRDSLNWIEDDAYADAVAERFSA